MTYARQDLISSIASHLSSQQNLAVIAITGLDASGKTSIADELAQQIRSTARPVVKISIDDFYNPRRLWQTTHEPAQAWYKNGYNYADFIQDVMIPLRNARKNATSAKIPLKIFDRVKDEPLPKEMVEVPARALVIVEGIFLMRSELKDSFDRTVFVHAPLDTLMARSIQRDTGRLGTAEDVFNVLRDTYLGAHRFYMQESCPITTADVFIDNTDFTNPRTAEINERLAIAAQLRSDLAELPSRRFTSE